MNVPLHEIAHGRTGDKGNRANMSLFAYTDDAYKTLIEQVTVDRIREMVSHRAATTITRYELPRLNALNFVIDDVLEGGVNGNLNLDGHGKTMSFHILRMTVEVTPELLSQCKLARTTE
ncbi:hypothetical protein GHR37_17330 [Achromobacter xylosoxidans]|nr:hypothetical protein [Achromobacter xylosoxidans]